jgi:hypothetical protein
MTVTEYYALTFKTPLPASEVFRRLREGGPWKWIDRDSERWGDYVSSIGVPGAIVKVFVGEPSADRCAANVEFESDVAGADAQAEAVRKTLVETILPALEARDICIAPFLE